MESLKNRIRELLMGTKAVIRPLYRVAQRLLSGRSKFDSPSMLAIETIDGFEVAYRKGTADEEVLKDSFSHDIFYLGVPEYKPAEDDVIIDIGAHIGTFSLLSSSKVRRGKVYSIEACQDTFNILRINVALNRLPNVSVHHLAISDKEGEVTLYYDIGNWGHSIVEALSASSESVKSTTLSRFLESNHIESCQFIKFNCEGAEFPILLSTSPKVLERFGTILVLYHCDLWRKNTEADLTSHLQIRRVQVRHPQPDEGTWLDHRDEYLAPTDQLRARSARRDALFAALETLGGQIWLSGTDKATFGAIEKRALMLKVTPGFVTSRFQG